MSKSVAFEYGFAEGSWQGKRFREALKHAGFSIAQDAQHADIVITHSAGCFYLPKPNPHQLTVLIGPPFWPGKPMILSFMQKFWRDLRDCADKAMFGYFLRKTFWNVLYIIGGPRKLLLISKNARYAKFYAALNNRQVVIIRNKNDAWLTPDVRRMLGTKADFKLFELPGQHDDCWHNPDPYIKVLQSVV